MLCFILPLPCQSLSIAVNTNRCEVNENRNYRLHDVGSGCAKTTKLKLFHGKVSKWIPDKMRAVYPCAVNSDRQCVHETGLDLLEKDVLNKISTLPANKISKPMKTTCWIHTSPHRSAPPSAVGDKSSLREDAKFSFYFPPKKKCYANLAWCCQCCLLARLSFSFYPAQVTFVSGIDPTFDKLLLRLPFSPASLSITAPNTLQIPDGERLQIVSASGPYTFSDELSYAPLTDFLSYVVQHQPHVCVLMGPFVDIKNKIIETGDLDVTYHELFMQLMDKIASTLQGLKTQVVLVASARDAHHDVIYPTPPYLFAQSLGPNFHVVPDPCVIDIAGLQVAVTATDILFHLGKEEVAAAPPGSDRLGRLASHLLKQRTFYPLFPSNEEVSLDLHFWEQRALLQEKPHVIILPSDLRMFIKDIEDCLIVNPERLCKGSSGGSFLRLQVDSSCGIQGEILRI
nr:EOG090X07VJ [Triops cancriformis]